jgi:2-succinyl-5-enolpyruvyl-6-hydroxy-3-cyclohexene-1-carboxylate synthase
MQTHYTDEQNALILIALLKAHGIRRVVASPGSTNVCFVASIQQDPWFQIWSAPDERSAGYMACGMAAECGEPVVLSCTGATASRNYMPALTEACYRKLPVLVVTSSRRSYLIGHNIAQITDRVHLPTDIA